MIDIQEIADMIRPAVEKLDADRRNAMRLKRNFSSLVKALSIPAFTGICVLLALTAASFYFDAIHGDNREFTHSGLFQVIVFGGLGLFLFTLVMYVLVPHYIMLRDFFGYHDPEFILHACIRKDLVKPMLARLAPAYEYKPEEHLPLFRHLRLVTEKLLGAHHIRGSSYIKGKLNKREFEVSDVEVEIKKLSKETYYRIADLCVAVHTPEISCNTVLLLNSHKEEDLKAYLYLFRTGRTLPRGDQAFDDSFTVSATTLYDAEKVLNSAMRKRLLAFLSAHPSLNAIAFVKGMLIATFRTRHELFHLDLSRPLVPYEVASDMMLELKTVLSLVTDTMQVLPALAHERKEA